LPARITNVSSISSLNIEIWIRPQCTGALTHTDQKHVLYMSSKTSGAFPKAQEAVVQNIEIELSVYPILV